MHRFAALYRELDARAGLTARVAALLAYFQDAEPADAAWALHVLLGRQGRRLITGRRLREICLAGSPLPAWLFDDCYAQVGDSAETIALLWQQFAPSAAGGEEGRAESGGARLEPLHRWMEVLLPAAAGLEGEEQAEAVRALWQGLSPDELLVANKLFTGGLRVGVGQGLVLRALARLNGVEEARLQHRLMGGFVPSAAAFAALVAAAEAGERVASQPYPFFLASPLEVPAAPDGSEAVAPLPGAAADWLVEWKFDGIRGQLIRRDGSAFLWSRGEELINAAFPEVIAAAAALPEGTVLDGEVLVWREGDDRPAPFAALQRRLGRKAPGRALLAEAPGVFVAYDLLEHGGEEWRERPLRERRAALEGLLSPLPPPAPGPPAAAPSPHRLRLSPLLPLTAWSELERLRSSASAAGAEGLMLKAAASPYLAGRRRGHWWKHKREPLRLDAVLLYAQAGSGRRANLFTDYTFGLWNGEGQLVSFAKAYSGLNDGEIAELDRWIRRHTTERFGPVRAVAPLLVFELAFEGLQPSGRHKSGIAVRFPRIARWRRDKPAAEADSLATALALLQAPG
jgi:DNA ligase-1